LSASWRRAVASSRSARQQHSCLIPSRKIRTSCSPLQPAYIHNIEPGRHNASVDSRRRMTRFYHLRPTSNVSCCFSSSSNENEPAEEADDDDDDYNDEEEDDYEEEEEYVIQNLSASGTTMERIMEAWAESSSVVTPPVKKYDSAGDECQPVSSVSSLPIRYSPAVLDKRRAIENAWTWYNRMENGQIQTEFLTTQGAKRYGNRGARRSSSRQQYQQQQHEQPQQSKMTNDSPSPVGVRGCNAILHALAEGNQSNVNDSSIRNYKSSQGTTNNTKEKDEFENTEQMASVILKRMKSPIHDDGVDRTPNLETFHAYMRCIRRDSPEETAEAAQFLWNKMMSQGKYFHHDLPAPNLTTLNIVVDLWSRVPQTGKDMVGNILKTYIMINDGDSTGMRPDRTTFVHALSSLIHIGSFDMERANAWIVCMEENHQTFCTDESLVVDSTVYEAPLRWSGETVGSVMSSSSKARSAPWDDHEQIFKDGFRIFSDGEKDSLTQEALDMERWVEQSNQQFPTTTRMYESLIQAWVRTGTVQGIIRAEQLALQALDNDSTNLRLQSFHPIIAGWAHCGSDRGPSRISAWIEKLDTLGRSTSPALKPDGRLWGALVISWRSMQKRLMEPDKTTTEDMLHDYLMQNMAFSELPNLNVELEATQDSNSEGIKMNGAASDLLISSPMIAAQGCTSALERICDMVREQSQVKTDGQEEQTYPIFLETMEFSHAVEAWGDLSLVSETNQDQNSLANHPENDDDIIKDPQKYARVEMFKAVEMLDSLVEYHRSLLKKHMLERSGREEDGNDYPTDKNDLDTLPSEIEALSQQLSHWMGVSVDVYAKAVTFLNTEGENTTSGDQTASPFIDHFSNVEAMLRRSEEFEYILNRSKDPNIDGGFSDNEGLLVYEDLYSYDHQSKVHGSLLRLSSNLDDKREDDILYSRELYMQILQGCQKLDSPSTYGDAIRVTMFILERLAAASHSFQPSADDRHCQDTVDVTDVCLAIVSVVGKVIPNVSERVALISRIYDTAKHAFGDCHGQSHARMVVDKNVIVAEIGKIVGDVESIKNLGKEAKKATKRRSRQNGQRRSRA